MLANAQVIDAVADALESHGPRYIVLDPVMVATSGARLLEPSALEALRTRLLPMASVITPNLPEAELLLGAPIADRAAMRCDAMRAACCVREPARVRRACGAVQGWTPGRCSTCCRRCRGATPTGND